MNRLILLGNGFDLAHGLPTSYEDFIFNYTQEEIKKCLNNEIKEDNKNLFNLKLLTDNQENIETLLNSLLQIKTKSDLINFINKHFTLNSTIQYNYSNQEKKEWINYTNQFVNELVTKNKGNNWSDIESFYYSLIVTETPNKTA